MTKLFNFEKKVIMNNSILKQEKETFKEKGWKSLVIITSIIKLLSSIITLIFLISKMQDETKDLTKMFKKKKR